MKELLYLFLIFFRIGITTFGGGYAMISNIKEVIVEKEKWIDEEELLEICAIAESTPGPIAINMATYIGYKRKKLLGSVFATLGVVLPSLIIIFIISLFFYQFLENKYVSYAFVGIKCAVAFLILKTALEMIYKAKKNIFQMIILTIVTIIMIVIDIFSFSFSSIYLILIGGVIGLIFYTILENKENVK